MTSSNGTEYYLKSMNGIKSFDDGSGTVIEDDTITCATINCQTFSADYLTALNNVTGENITANDSMMALTMTTDDLIVNNIAQLKGNTQIYDLEITNTFKVAVIEPPRFISEIGFWKDTALPLYFAKFNFFNYAINATDTTQPINLFTDCTSTLNIGNKSNTTPTQIYIGRFLINNNTIEPYNVSANLNIFTTTESTSRISFGKFRFDGYSFGPNLNTDCSLFTALTTRILTFGPSSGQLIMPTTNIISLGPNIKIQTTSLYSNAVDSVINLFNNITTGTINLGNSLTTGILQIAGKFRHATTNVIGYSRFIEIAASNTITPPIDIQFYVYVRGSLSSTLTLPSYIDGQLITIRNAKLNQSAILTVSAAAGQLILSGPGVTNSSITMSYYSCYSFYCDGSKWIIMDKS